MDDKFPPGNLPEENSSDSGNPCEINEEETRDISEEKHRDINKEWAEALHLEYEPSAAPPPPPMPGRPASDPVPEPPMPGNPSPVPPAPAPIQNSKFPIQNSPMPPTYFVWSVLATVLCCFIPGIIGIVYSSMVSSRYYTGDFEGARRASRNAEICIIISIVLGVVSSTLYIPLSLLL